MAKGQLLMMQLSMIVIIVLLQVPPIFSLGSVEDHAKGTVALLKGPVGISSRELSGNMSSRLRYLHKPSLSATQDFRDGIKRSLARQENFYSRIRGASSALFMSPVYPLQYEHAIELQFGTPPQAKVLLAVDTGSHFTWTQCTPCPNCDPQAAPGLFDPVASSSFTPLSCGTGLCGFIEAQTDKGVVGSCSARICQYSLQYLDGTSSSGDVALEVITSPSSGASTWGNIMFGCGHDNHGISQINGVLGLDTSILSFASQLGKFSMCLLSPEFYGKGKWTAMGFGSDAVFPIDAAYQSASIIVNQIRPGFPLYYVKMVSIAVDGVVLKIDSSLFNFDSSGFGGVIMDSNTAYSSLYPDVYDALVAQMLVAVPTNIYADDSPCWPLTPSGIESMVLPDITFNMDTGSMSLSRKGTYTVVGGNACLAMIKFTGSKSYPSVIAGSQMINQFMIFDPTANKILFAPYDCTRVASSDH